jgi:hypothetical protein
VHSIHVTDLIDVNRIDVTSRAVEIQRIIRSATIWTAAGVLAPVIGLGPLLATGWRPGELGSPGELFFWIGAIVAAVGLASLVWAGCPVLGFTLEGAYRQKVICIHIGIVINLAGMAVCGLTVLLN